MRETDTRTFTALLTGAVIGVYALIVAGATAAIADAASACSSWPTCSQPPSLTEPALMIAWGHRVTALLVGLLVIATAVVGWRVARRRRVKYALAVALALFPVQIGVGAAVATTGAAGEIPSVHLGVAASIFGALVAALAWHLEAGADDQPVTTDPEPVSEPVGDVTVTRPSGLVETVRAYVSLTKPRLMWLLSLVAAAGMALAADGSIPIETILATIGGGVLAIGSSGTFNHVLERDVDRRMNRTADRPLTTEQVPVTNALAFGFALGALSLAAFLTVNVLVAVLGLVAIVFYSVIYTLVLKPNTVQNTVIGGFAGALPALIGSAAVTGTIGPAGLALATLIFLWTPAHFYNLALAYKDDYARGGFPMMPVVRGEATTRKHILWYLAATLLAATVVTAIADLGALVGATTVVLGAVFLWMVVRLHRERTESAAFRAFHASNAYLGAFLVAVVIDALAI
ncbi:Polyprenyltransferase (cytochrome oxidase assembly factor) [Halapricum desulfuricans]|uniref:Protoheme IX farnesyltransferase n=1 Tax=Halapricum desulfuricans TaxID=2841257 RepID=A0A897NGJ9_9EURY|nr:heme o synthase [Halapricum desulfuricans]QSG11842.1 Polyprenyltransferase (cytochrome oxidase assembly factor) [Halapricum desulfuricans]